jgi:hypothetical protein
LVEFHKESFSVIANTQTEQAVMACPVDVPFYLD